MLKCGRCQEFKPVEKFGVARGRPTGRHGYCRKCKADANRRYREAGRVSKGDTQAQRERHAQRHPERVSARNAVNHAVARGVLIPISERLCLDCGCQARRYDHHLGYSREHWLDVQAVCIPCDMKRDAARGVRNLVTA